LSAKSLGIENDLKRFGIFSPPLDVDGEDGAGDGGWSGGGVGGSDLDDLSMSGCGGAG